MGNINISWFQNYFKILYQHFAKYSNIRITRRCQCLLLFKQLIYFSNFNGEWQKTTAERNYVFLQIMRRNCKRTTLRSEQKL